METKPVFEGQQVVHPIYGNGKTVKIATGRFWHVRFEKPTNVHGIALTRLPSQ